MFYWICISLVWVYMNIFYPTKIIGKKNLNKNKCIWACNHTTNFDAFVLGAKTYARFYPLGKSELFKNKFQGWILKRLGTICVHRGQSDIEAVKQCMRVLKEKQKPLLIFPTGTRESTPDEVQNLKNGVAMFAIKANAPIIPMVIVRKPKIFRRNRLVIGEPIDVSQYQGQKATKEMYEEINEKISKSMEEMLEKYSFKKREKKQKKSKNSVEA